MCIICTTEDHSTLTKLTSLDCRGCQQIKEIPSTLTNLTILDCSWCNEVKEIPSTLTNLRELYCSDCPLLKEIPSTLTNLRELNCSYCPNLYYIGIKTEPIYYNFDETHFGNYNWITHQNRFKYRIAVRKICDFMYKLYIRKQKERILALQLWRYGLQDIKDIILKKLIK